ncbi:MAG: DNA-directed RNA polymerase subunit alpha [Fusobacteriaceae bacterium]|nr:DNA-directed RNA polymerase subunit alpha [Fusobacteriaceae bacterium]
MLNIEKRAKNIKITENKENNFSGQYIVEPLYRGYGNTIGNALRRILLSSIPGAAIKAVRIDGVLNEFSTMEGVVESVDSIVLNIKELVIKAETTGEKRMSLTVKGPKVITGADIVTDSEIEIINPEQVICEITTDREVSMEFITDTGEGFITSEEIDKKDWPVDFIAVDAIYTPIRKVSYKVEDTMVGRMTDYDKLILDIETDGSINIRDAVSYAAELLTLHFQAFLDLGNKMENLRTAEEEEEEVSETVASDQEILGMKIDELDLTVRSFNCLKKAGIEAVGELARLNMNDLLKIKNLGRKSLEEIIDKMKELGFDLNSNTGE